jgi:DNA-binding response OmpR family regulator
MRVLIVGKLHGHIGTASKIALKRGAQVLQVEDVDAALEALRSGKGADLLMIDVALDVAKLCASLTCERITVPVVAGRQRHSRRCQGVYPIAARRRAYCRCDRDRCAPR